MMHLILLHHWDLRESRKSKKDEKMPSTCEDYLRVPGITIIVE